ncbi:MAG: hypothetical protein PHX70_12255 [Clostridium sp.]|nr:hypothetical protein [Clostridium sp.]
MPLYIYIKFLILYHILNQIINTVVPVVVTGIVGVLVAILKVVGDSAVSYISEKKNSLATQIGVDTYNSNLEKAKDIWGIVDEEFRITPTLEKTVEAKKQMFDKFLKKAVPLITDDEISNLRQTVAGEVNKGKAVVTADEVAKQNEMDSVKVQNVQLTTENAQLKQKLTTIQNTAAVQNEVQAVVK